MAHAADALQPVLWPPGQPPHTVWAVLDGARDPAIRRALVESRLEYRCLYSGPLHPSLEAAAPQLVELLPGHRLTARLLDEGFGRSWGVYLRIADPANLRHHLRKLLKVAHEDGRRLLFRFYDPRVLRDFLPTCTPDQLEQLFGPVAAFFTEGAQGHGLVEWKLAGRRLVRTEHLVPEPAP